MAINIIDKFIQFPSVRQEVIWNRRSDPNAGPPLKKGSFVHHSPAAVDPFDVNNAAMVINRNGRAARVRMNDNVDLDLNFALGETCVAALYPEGRTMPENTPIVFEFSNPISALGAFISFLGDNVLRDGRDMLGIMWVQLDNQPNSWELAFSKGVTGTSIAVGAAATAPFVGAQSNGNKIKKVWFDVSLAGNFDAIVLSRLMWVA
jgi:hypothetical protein